MNRITFALVLVLSLAFGASVGHAQSAATLDKIGPSRVTVGDPDFTLRVRGENFTSSSVVLLDGEPLETRFVSKKVLHAHVPADVTGALGDHVVAVRTGSATTGTATLSVITKDAGVTLTRVNPDSLQIITANGAIIFRVGGTGLGENSQALVYGQEVTTRLFDRNVLEIEIPTTLLRAPGLVPIQVKGNGGLSNLVTVVVLDRAATITSVTPPSAAAGSDAVTLTIAGANFLAGATVLFNGVELVPTSVKSDTIKVVVPASLLADVAQAVIYVVQPSGLSNAALFRITPAGSAPVVYSVAPDEIQAGTSGQTIDVSGANFAESSQVLVNGSPVRTNFVGRARVTFKLTKEQLAAPGATYTVQVRNNDGTVSNAFAIAVVDAAVVSTISGERLDGFVDGALGTARFRRPSRLAVGPDGLLYIADQQNHAIRRLNPTTGVVETLAGDGQAGYVDSGDSTKPDLAVPRFNNPLGVAVGSDGTIYVADYGNEVIRRMRPSGSGYLVDTIAGKNVRIDSDDTRTEKFSTRRGVPGFANGDGLNARFRGVDGMAISSTGVLYVADSLNQYIRAIDTTSSAFTVSTVSGVGISGFADGPAATARYTLPLDVALTPDESTLVVADFGNNRVRRVDLETGFVSTVAGSGVDGVAAGPPLEASFVAPIGVTVATDGTIYVTDHFSSIIRKIDVDGTTTTLAGTPARTKFRDGIGPAARFSDPRGIVYHRELGLLFVADQGHHRIRVIEP